jgi:hypothetical protein
MSHTTGQATSQVSIDLSEFDTPATPRVVNKTPTPLARFLKAANKQKAKLLAGAPGNGSDWYRLLPDGTVDQIVVRNGITTIKVGAEERRKLNDAQTAARFFDAVMTKAQNGDLDAEFARTKKVK